MLPFPIVHVEPLEVSQSAPSQARRVPLDSLLDASINVPASRPPSSASSAAAERAPARTVSELTVNIESQRWVD
jgi:hypothetical protein